MRMTYSVRFCFFDHGIRREGNMADQPSPDRFKAEMPEGGFYLWLRTPVDDCEFARRLHHEYNVLVLPGSYLAREAGGENPGRNHVRIALVAPLAECVEAIERLMKFARGL